MSAQGSLLQMGFAAVLGGLDDAGRKHFLAEAEWESAWEWMPSRYVPTAAGRGPTTREHYPFVNTIRPVNVAS